jgi:hypothetical protein
LLLNTFKKGSRYSITYAMKVSVLLSLADC